MPIYYHVSTEINHNGTFIPRIPITRRADEDISTNRVSVSTSLEKCLTGMPCGGSRLEILNIYRRGYYKVFKINTDKLNITKENIVTPEDLFKEDRVPDADFTNEYWITCSFTVDEEDTEIIKLNDWDEDSIDDIPYHIYELSETQKYGGDYLNAYIDVYGKDIPCAIEIKNGKYTGELAKKGEEITLSWDNDEEMDEIKRLIKSMYNVKAKVPYPGEITFTTDKNCSLRELFIEHVEFLQWSGWD